MAAVPKKKITLTLDTQTTNTESALKLAELARAALTDVRDGHNGVTVSGVAVR